MDIQRGDQVYYRGEVWTVKRVQPLTARLSTLTLRGPVNSYDRVTIPALSTKVQRVEQVR